MNVFEKLYSCLDTYVKLAITQIEGKERAKDELPVIEQALNLQKKVKLFLDKNNTTPSKKPSNIPKEIVFTPSDAPDLIDFGALQKKRRNKKRKKTRKTMRRKGGR